jgi:dihydrodipicolinate reductase
MISGNQSIQISVCRVSDVVKNATIGFASHTTASEISEFKHSGYSRLKIYSRGSDELFCDSCTSKVAK